MNAAQSTPYNRAHHHFIVLLACLTFVLLTAGALVTSNDAGLAVPDWPTSFGSIYKIPPMVGGVMYEHGHRMIAQFIGFLTIILAVWTWRTDRRIWMKRTGVAALALVIVQGIFGGITVLNQLPPAVSTIHAMLAQTFFSLIVAMAVFTSRSWIEGRDEVAADGRTPSLVTLALLAVVVVYVQLFLGGMFRHKGMGWLPHVLNAATVTLILTWASLRGMLQFRAVQSIRKTSMTMLLLLAAQICLGFMAFVTRVEWGHDAAQPATAMIVTTVVHTVTGALLIAAAWSLLIFARRNTLPVHQVVREVERKAVTA